MALFKKNPNETVYTGGKKHWADVIKNSGPGELLVWRQPEEDFNTHSTLIVMPGEQAIFVNKGRIEQVFDNGTYKLSTSNYPFISRLRNAVTGGISTFNCVVYFVRSADSQEIRWGTDSPIQVRDQIWGIRTEAKVRGTYRIRIEHADRFLSQLIGSNVVFQTQGDFQKYFAGEFQGRIKSAVSRFLSSTQTELIGLDAHLDELSDEVTPLIDESLRDYGLKCAGFSLVALDIDISKYDQIDVSQVELIARQRGFIGDKFGLDTLGNDWGRVQGVGIMNELVKNQAASGLAAAGAGIGLGIGAAGGFSGIARQVLTDISLVQPSQVNQNDTDTADCKSGQSGSPDARIRKLRELKSLLDEDLIERAEYDAEKAAILQEITAGT